MQTPKFSKATPFQSELRGRIRSYFNERNLKQTGNRSLYWKAILLVTMFVGTYIHLVFFTPFWAIALLECILLGGLASAIGFNVMHDGAHGSFSSKKWVNELAGVTINFLGANVFMWKTKHNVAHHTFTNIPEMDDDMNARPLLRLCPAQKHYKIHRFQHHYFLFVYAILYLYWVFVTDYKKYVLRRVGGTPIQPMKLMDHVSFWGFKILHLVLFIAVPVYMVGWSAWLIGFLTFGISTGVFLSVVFQLAHSLEETNFPTPDAENHQLEDDWAVHQLKTTSNFATDNKVLSWLVGGLNYQVEHHLFPNVSHIHYPAISKIVRQTCEEYNVPYLEHSRMRHAFVSHMNHLRELGRV